MGAFLSTCIPAGLLILAVLGLLLWLRPRVVTVLEEERPVLYQMGRLKGLATPGLHLYLVRFITVGRVVTVRNEPSSFTVGNLIVGGAPVGLTINLWSCFDPAGTSGKNRAKEIELLRFTDEERRIQMETLLRKSLVRRLDDLERARNLPADADAFTRLQPVLPGAPLNEQILSEVKEDIAHDWRDLGVVLDQGRPLVVVGLQIPDEWARSFRRGRELALLRQHYPGLDDRWLATVMAAIEVGKLPSDTMMVAGDEADNVRIEKRTQTEDGERRVIRGPKSPAASPGSENVTPDSTDATPATANATTPPAGPTANPSGPLPPGTGPRLSRSDMAVLKRVPRDKKPERASA